MQNPLELLLQTDELLRKAEANLEEVEKLKTAKLLEPQLARCYQIREALEQKKWNFFSMLLRFALFFNKRWFPSSFKNEDGLELGYRIQGYEDHIPAHGDLRQVVVNEYEVVPNSKFIGSSTYVFVIGYKSSDRFYDLCQAMLKELQICLADQSKDVEDFKIFSKQIEQLM